MQLPTLRFRAAAPGVAAAWLLWAGASGAAAADLPKGLGGPAGAEMSAPVDIKADSLQYGEGGRQMTGVGHVFLRQGKQILTADRVQYNPESGDMLARGHVVFVRADGSVWKGEQLSYNFKSGTGNFGSFVYYVDPMYLYAEESSMPAANTIELKGLTVTTCKGESREYQIKAASATLTDQRYLVARHAIVCLGPVPIMWWPVYKRDLQGTGQWDFIPGYSSRLGAYLLTTYNYSISPERELKGATSLNLYSERGVGAAQEFKWEGTNHLFRGGLRSFYINDAKIYKNEAQRADREELLTDKSRYRVSAAHTQYFGERNSFIGEGTYLSDPWVLDDFFRHDFRSGVQPENYGVYTHNGDEYSASLSLNSRLNDFYDNVNRLPEAQFSVWPLSIGESPFYYEGQHSAAQLERVYPKGDRRDDYQSLRVDTANTISYPGRYLGFLSLTPRVGGRATYYSKTLGDTYAVTNLVTVTDTNGVSYTTNEVGTVTPELGGDTRALFELGLATSFKAFKVIEEGETTWGRGLRHIVEPYADYSYIPEPNLRPDNLYQFDVIDRLDMQHTVTLGLRNQLQTRTKRAFFLDHATFNPGDPMDRTFDGIDTVTLQQLPENGTWSVLDLVNADVYSYYRIEKQEGEDDFGPVTAYLDLRPSDRFWARVRGNYDMYASTLINLDSQFTLRVGEDTTFSLQNLYRNERTDTWAGQIDVYPKAKWGFRGYWRYDSEGGRLEEQSYFVRHTMKCIGWGIGVRDEPPSEPDGDQNFGVWLQFWLLDLAGSDMQIGG